MNKQEQLAAYRDELDQMIARHERIADHHHARARNEDDPTLAWVDSVRAAAAAAARDALQIAQAILDELLKSPPTPPARLSITATQVQGKPYWQVQDHQDCAPDGCPFIIFDGGHGNEGLRRCAEYVEGATNDQPPT